MDIKNRFTGNIIFSINADTLSGANLSRADLSGADLSGADLSGANLSGANLSRANLSGADLWACIGNMHELKTISIEKWIVTYSATDLQIGCKKFSIERWRGLSDQEINALDTDALEFWRKFKKLIFEVIELSPAVQLKS